MADSIRQQIISALDTRLKTILVSNGYETNAGQNVFAWRGTALEVGELDAILYRDRTEVRTPGMGIYEFNMPIEIQLVSTSAAQVRKMLADLEVVLFIDETFGGLALNSEIETDEMEIEQKEYAFVASGVVISIEYRTSRGNPYSIEPGTDRDAILIHNIEGWLSDFAMDSNVSRDDADRIVRIASQFDDTYPLFAPSDNSKKPLWIPNGLNGNPTIRFDGVNDYLQTADYVWNQPCIFYIVCKVIAFTSVWDQIISGGSCPTPPPTAPWLAMESANTLKMLGPYSGPAASYSVGSWMIVRAVFNGGNSTLRVNLNDPSIGNPGDYGFNGLTVGRQGDFDINYSNIEVARIVSFTSLPSVTEDAFIMNTLNNRYAIY